MDDRYELPMLDLDAPRSPRAIPGRGASGNVPNRFEPIAYEACDPDGDFGPVEEVTGPRTSFYKDFSRTLIVSNDSPDIFFDVSINPYRGCEHGCIYCYARPFHEYLGLSAGLDFETKIFVKEDAPVLLRKELNKPSWKPQVLSISGVTDAYQPAERRFQLTRRLLEILAEFRNPVGIVTKNRLVTRDRDLLKRMAEWNGVSVYIAVTSLDPELAKIMEPRASAPHARLTAISELASVGVPVGVLAAPVIPGLTDHEIPAILKAAHDAGARSAGYTLLRLPFALKELFANWLDQHYPVRKDKILGRIREIRGGKLNDPHFGTRMKGTGPIAEMIGQIFRNSARKLGYASRSALSTDAFRRPNETPTRLFE